MSETDNSGPGRNGSLLISGQLAARLCGDIDCPKSRAIARQALSIFEQWLQRRAAARGTVDGELPPVTDGECYGAGEECCLEACLLLIKTLIYASRIDECLDQDELGPLCSVYQVLCAQFNAQGFIDEMMTSEVNPAEIARAVRFDEEALDIYLLSSMLLDGPHFLEHNYLEGLGAALHIAPSLQRELDKKARELLHAESAGA